MIQTESEVILVGTERKKRERRMPGRYRDSAPLTAELETDVPVKEEMQTTSGNRKTTLYVEQFMQLNI